MCCGDGWWEHAWHDAESRAQPFSQRHQQAHDPFLTQFHASPALQTALCLLLLSCAPARFIEALALSRAAIGSEAEAFQFWRSLLQAAGAAMAATFATHVSWVRCLRIATLAAAHRSGYHVACCLAHVLAYGHTNTLRAYHTSHP